MHLTLAAASSLLPPHQPATNVSTNAPSPEADFASLLESLGTGINPVPQAADPRVKVSAPAKKGSPAGEVELPVSQLGAPKQKRDEPTRVQAPATTRPVDEGKDEDDEAQIKDEESDSLVFGAVSLQNARATDPLPIALVVPAREEAQPQSDSTAQETADAPSKTITAVLPGMAPSTLKTSPHTQEMFKTVIASPLEKLQNTRIPVSQSSPDEEHGEIAFEAMLTPKTGATSNPSVSPSPTAHSPASSVPIAQTQSDGKQNETTAKPAEKQAKPEDHMDATPDSAPHPQPAQPLHQAAQPANQEAFSAPVANASKPVEIHKAPEHTPPAASSPEMKELPAPRTEPARDISFRIGSTSSEAVDVKLVDRAGQIHVAVRSSDPALTQSLQANITELAGKLERSGFQTETSIPNRVQTVRDPQQNFSFQDSERERRAPQQTFQQRKKRTAPSAGTFSINSIKENS